MDSGGVSPCQQVPLQLGPLLIQHTCTHGWAAHTALEECAHKNTSPVGNKEPEAQGRDPCQEVCFVLVTAWYHAAAQPSSPICLNRQTLFAGGITMMPAGGGLQKAMSSQWCRWIRVPEAMDPQDHWRNVNKYKPCWNHQGCSSTIWNLLAAEQEKNKIGPGEQRNPKDDQKLLVQFFKIIVEIDSFF